MFTEKKEQLMDLAYTTLCTQEDEYSVVGNIIALQLKGMDEKQRLIAEKLVSDVMFYGRMGKVE